MIYTLNRMAEIKEIKDVKDVEQLKLSCTAGGDGNWYNHFGKLSVSTKPENV